MPDLYPRHSDGTLALTTSLVLFLDVLGTREKARASEAEQTSYLNQLSEALDRALARSFSDGAPDHWYRALAFTDNIALGCPIPLSSDGEDELGTILTTATLFQWDMAERGLFVRGGLSLGKAYFDTRFAFGPALNEAYRLESEVADWGRIVLGEELRPMLAKHGEYYDGGLASSPHNGHIVVGAGQMFLNYLGIVSWDVEEDIGLPRHRNVIQQELTRHRSSPSVLDKYVWLAAYHNYYCSISPNWDQYRIADDGRLEARSSTFQTLADWFSATQ